MDDENTVGEGSMTDKETQINIDESVNHTIDTPLDEPVDMVGEPVDEPVDVGKEPAVKPRGRPKGTKNKPKPKTEPAVPLKGPKAADETGALWDKLTLMELELDMQRKTLERMFITVLLLCFAVLIPLLVPLLLRVVGRIRK